MGFYNLIWYIGRPVLRLNKRLLKGWDQRQVKALPSRADVWLHAASAGEAYLVQELATHFTSKKHFRFLVTTNTSQGMGILSRAREALDSMLVSGKMAIRYFPFDHPRLMQRVVDAVRPKLVVILETELWPGFLAALRSRRIPVVVINGRLNSSSLKRYMLWPSFWRSIAPTRILAVSAPDAGRFGRLYPDTRVEVMTNIKFDHWYRQLKQGVPSDRLANLFSSDQPLVVLGSVRQEEEDQTLKMIHRIHKALPKTMIAIFPRHMNRLDAWQKYLSRGNRSWTLRSRIDGLVKPGAMVLWDTFGELRDAYAMATAAFVGGSLAPLGGQNFLEPLACGVIPVIGPSWFNFLWVGEGIFEKRLVFRANDWLSVADQIVTNLKQPVSHKTVRHQAMAFADHRTGGSRKACRLIETFLTDLTKANLLKRLNGET